MFLIIPSKRKGNIVNVTTSLDKIKITATVKTTNVLVNHRQIAYITYNYYLAKLLNNFSLSQTIPWTNVAIPKIVCEE